MDMMHFNVVGLVHMYHVSPLILITKHRGKDLKCKLCMLCPYIKDILPFLLVTYNIKYQARHFLLMYNLLLAPNQLTKLLPTRDINTLYPQYLAQTNNSRDI